MATGIAAVIAIFLAVVFFVFWRIGRKFGEVRDVVATERTPGEDRCHLWIQVRDIETGEPKWLRLTRRQFADAQTAAAHNSADNPF